MKLLQTAFVRVTLGNARPLRGESQHYSHFRERSHVHAGVCRTDDNCQCECDELTSLEPPLLALWLVSELMCDGRGYELNTAQMTFGTFEESKNKTGH